MYPFVRMAMDHDRQFGGGALKGHDRQFGGGAPKRRERHDDTPAG